MSDLVRNPKDMFSCDVTHFRSVLHYHDIARYEIDMSRKLILVLFFNYMYRHSAREVIIKISANVSCTIGKPKTWHLCRVKAQISVGIHPF